MSCNFFMVWNPATGQTHHRHSFFQQARAEAERLAKANPAQKFYVLEAKGYAEVPPSSIYHELDDLSF